MIQQNFIILWRINMSQYVHVCLCRRVSTDSSDQTCPTDPTTFNDAQHFSQTSVSPTTVRHIFTCITWSPCRREVSKAELISLPDTKATRSPLITRLPACLRFPPRLPTRTSRGLAMGQNRQKPLLVKGDHTIFIKGCREDMKWASYCRLGVYTLCIITGLISCYGKSIVFTSLMALVERLSG